MEETHGIHTVFCRLDAYLGDIGRWSGRTPLTHSVGDKECGTWESLLVVRHVSSGT